MANNNKNNIQRGVINNASFAYVSIRYPKKKFKSEETEWSVLVFVTEEEQSRLSKEFSNLKFNPLTDKTFAEKYGPKEGKEGLQNPFPGEVVFYQLNLRRNTKYSTGEEVPEDKAPKIYYPKPGDKKGAVIDITHKVDVGNGSRGKAHFYTIKSDRGTGTYLASIIVEDLVKYERKEAPGAFTVEEVSDDELDALFGSGAVEAAKEEKTAKAAAATGGGDTDAPWDK